MKTFLKIILFAAIGLAIGIAGLLLYVKFALPDVGDAEEIEITYTPERIARGFYLANTVCVCMDCHSTRDWTKFSAPLKEGTFGRGGDRFDQSVGMPGVFYAKNITPAGIGRYTDGELFRVITTGVTKEGRAMFPFMPYPYYGKMDREDIYSIIAYLRSLPAIENPVPESTPDFPVNFIVNTIPQKAPLPKKPDPSDQLAYGAYLTNSAGCIECHTPVDKGRIIPEKMLGGGRRFPMPDGSTVVSANITPHERTGIGTWSRDAFVARFKAYADSAYVPPTIKKGEFNTIMPWMMYGRMTEEDLAAIYTYLKTVQPIDNEVEIFVAAQ